MKPILSEKQIKKIFSRKWGTKKNLMSDVTETRTRSMENTTLSEENENKTLTNNSDTSTDANEQVGNASEAEIQQDTYSAVETRLPSESESADTAPSSTDSSRNQGSFVARVSGIFRPSSFMTSRKASLSKKSDAASKLLNFSKDRSKEEVSACPITSGKFSVIRLSPMQMMLLAR